MTPPAHKKTLSAHEIISHPTHNNSYEMFCTSTEQALEDSGISIAPLERPRAPDVEHMPPPPSIPGARTHRAERIAKEAANPLSSEKSATESITESSTDDEEGGHVKSSNIEQFSDTENVTGAGNASKDEHAEAGEPLSDGKHSNADEHSLDDKIIKDPQDVKTTDAHIEHSGELDNVSTPHLAIPDGEALVPSNPLKGSVSDDGIFLFLFILYNFDSDSDVDIGSPPPLQGASRMTGGVF